MEIIFVCTKFPKKGNTGGEKVTLRNYELLKVNPKIKKIKKIEIINYVEEYKELSEKTILDKFRVTKNHFLGYGAGLNRKKVLLVVDEIIKQDPKIIFLDNSLLGSIAKDISTRIKGVKIISFFHNIEAQAIISRIRSESLALLPLYCSSFKSEKEVVKYSDFLITLNNRDSVLLEKKYGKKSDLEIPVTLEDSFEKGRIKSRQNKNEIQLLFVGSLFFGNYTGIKWFIENVMSKLDKNIKLKVVGKDFESKKMELTRDNVEIIGTVDQLSSYYYDADIVISPIFEGGGMKVKIAEALMYGKEILGTPEAFEGYDIDYKKVGKSFVNQTDFISYLSNYKKKCEYKFNKYSRELFLKKYDFKTILNEVDKMLLK